MTLFYHNLENPVKSYTVDMFHNQDKPRSVACVMITSIKKNEILNIK